MTVKFVQHRSPETHRAKAPYNFVPLPEKVLPAEEFDAHDKYHADRHTGYIDLEITTETPLYTRCATPAEVWGKYQGEDYFEKDKPKVTAIPECQEFFHRGNADIPVIPGSTLRGMTRAIVEIISYSKISAVSAGQLVYRAVADSTSFGNQYREKMLDKLGDRHFNYPSKMMKGGYLEITDGKYCIRPAQEHSVSDPEDKRESFVLVERDSLPQSHRFSGSQVFVRPTSRVQTNNRGRDRNISLDLAFTAASITPASGFVSATIISTRGIGNSKHMVAAIYEQDPDDAKLIPILEKTWKTYEEDRDMQRGIPGRELKAPGEPLFYLLDSSNKLVFFGSTMMFRLPYTHKITDLIPEEIKNAGLDMAETVFGMVDEDHKKSLAGRVYFSDAICKSETDKDGNRKSPFSDGENNGRRIPRILSSPKPTSFQLYLNQPEPNHHQADPTRCYSVNGKTLGKVNAEPELREFVESLTPLKGNEFKSKEELREKLQKLGVNLDKLNENFELRRKLFDCLAHELRTYNDVEETEIRGFKRYWHKKNVSESEYVADSKVVRFDPGGKGIQERKKRKDGNLEDWKLSKQHTVIKPVRTGTKFENGRVYFENLSREELGALLVALELPPNMRHQLGMAKPYGLGTVKIVPTLVVQQRPDRYATLFGAGGWSDGSLLDADILQIKKSCVTAFKNKVKSFVGEFSFNKIQRLKELFTLLAWEEEDPNCLAKQYVQVTDLQWKSRHVLPFPTDIDQIDFIETAEEQIEKQDALYQTRQNEIGLIQGNAEEAKQNLRRLGKKIPTDKLADNQKSDLAKTLLVKANEVGIDVTSTKWFEEIAKLAKIEHR